MRHAVLHEPKRESMADALSEKVARYEAELIREALTACRGDIRHVTGMLGVPRKTLYDKMSRHGIQPSAHRG